MDVFQHKFEQAGLGRAPFRLVRVETRKYQACHGAPIQPGGTCDYCGEAIMECCIIRSSDDHEFTVGNVCVNKTGDAGLVNVTKREVNRLRTAARHERESARIQATREALTRAEVRTALDALPHPYEWARAKGMTRRDWSEWMMAHAGNAGRMEVARFIAQHCAV